MIFPDRVWGERVGEVDLPGRAPAPSRRRAVRDQLAPQRVPASCPGRSRPAFTNVPATSSGLPNTPACRHGGVLDEGRLDLEGADQVAGRLDDVVGPGDEPTSPSPSTRTRSPVAYQRRPSAWVTNERR